MGNQLPLGSKIAHNIGLVVLASQELERHLKVVVAAGGGSLAGVIDRHRKLEKRALGQVLERLLRNVATIEGSQVEFEKYVSDLLDRRNKVVHHFFEKYGEDLRVGRSKEVLADLAAIHGDLLNLADAFRAINESWLEHLQEVQSVSGK